jgi:site-specific DNA recombinase
MVERKLPKDPSDGTEDVGRGNPPLGYDVGDRKLIVNPAEAETVRFIFQRYLDLGCARLLCEDLAAQGVVSKRRTFADGTKRGGKPIGRSALYAILNNRVYLGETTHKGASYRGEHKAIVPRDLFNAVQQRLAELGPRLSSKVRAVQDALFAGLVFDETGTAMLPTYSIKKGGVRYRYYASRPTLKGERSKASISRIPAPPFEAFVTGTLARLGLSAAGTQDDVRALVRRIEAQPDGIVIQLHRDQALALWRAANPVVAKERDRDVMDRQRSLLANGEALTDYGKHLALSLPVRAQFRGGRASVYRLPGDADSTSRLDMALIKAVARACRWRQMLLDGEATSIEAIAKRFGLDRGHVGLTLKLAFLSPELICAIARGEQPPDLHLTHLIAADIPLSWERQREMFGSPTSA